MSCELCRKNHTKCDGQNPRCGRCLKAGRQCVRKPRSFGRALRPSQFGLPQTWVSIPPQVDFVDETLQFPQANVNAQASGQDEARIGFYNENDNSSRNHRQRSEQTISLGTQASFTESSPGSPSRPPKARLDYSTFSTKDSAELLRYFVDHCACFFDFSDADRHFAYHVPLRARQNETLANAMLALAARHRSRTSDFDPFVADQYYHACLQTMIPRLGNPTAPRDDELLAAIVILRLLEEMDVPIVGSDLQKHLFGTQAIINASQAQSPSPVTALRKACYWAAFRQEIFMSLSSQRTFKLRLPETPPSAAPLDDWSWSLRATYQCGKVQEFVFGGDSSNSVKYGNLMDEIESWKAERPEAFDPVYQEARQEDDLPDIRLQMDCHVMGWQYLNLAHLLLVAHQPLPRVGPLHRQSIVEMQRAVREDVMTLCGIARSNAHSPPAKLVACMAVALFGDRFDSKREQQLLNDFLADTENCTGWPTSKARKQLERAWGWATANSYALDLQPMT